MVPWSFFDSHILYNDFINLPRQFHFYQLILKIPILGITIFFTKNLKLVQKLETGVINLHTILIPKLMTISIHLLFLGRPKMTSDV